MSKKTTQNLVPQKRRNQTGQPKWLSTRVTILALLVMPTLAYATDVRDIGPLDRSLTRPESAPATNYGIWNGGAEDGGDIVFNMLEFRLNGFKGIEYTECAGVPHFHAQHIVRLPNKNGRAYFMVSNSSADVPGLPLVPAEPAGYLSVYRADADAMDPVTDLVVNTPDTDGEIVWEHIFREDPANTVGQWNHPAKMAVLGNVLVVAGQDWDGFDGCRDGFGRGSDASVLFYDVRDPENPQYWGRLTKSELGVPQVETVSLVKAGHEYILIVDNKWWRTGSVFPDLSAWKFGGTASMFANLQGEYFNSLEVYPPPSAPPAGVVQPGRERVAWFRGGKDESNDVGGDEVFTFKDLNFAPVGDPMAQSFTALLGSTVATNENPANFSGPNLWIIDQGGGVELPIHEKDYDAGGVAVVRGMPVVYTPFVYYRDELGNTSADKIWQVYNPNNLILQAPMATPPVTTANDDVPGSLRYAMQQGGTINIDPSLNGATIVLNRDDGPLTVGYRDDVTIDASHLPDGITISGDSDNDGFFSNADTRVFQIELGKTITMKNVTIERGWAPQGAGLLNVGGNVTLEDCVLRFNVAQGYLGLDGLEGDGGGILNGMLRRDNVNGDDGLIYRTEPCEAGSEVPECLYGGTLTLRNCTVEQNTATGNGGGIANIGGQLSVIDTTVASNHAVGGGGGVMNRGGVYTEHASLNFVQDGSIVFENSTIAENTAERGAGLFSDNAYELCSTLTGANDFFCTGVNSTTLNHTTVASNTVPFGAGMTAGIVNDPSINSVGTETPSDLLIENSIVAYNTDDGVTRNIRGTFTTGGLNIVPGYLSSSTWLGGFGPPSNNDPLLVPLSDSGGATRTLRPSTSVNLEAFFSRTLFPDTDPDTPLAVDQRGVTRPRGSGVSEIGAVEFLPPVDALDSPDLANIATPQTNGLGLESGWFGQSSEVCPPPMCAADNDDAMQSGQLPAASNFSSDMTAEFSGEGVLSFWWMISAQSSDLLVVFLDGVLQQSVSLDGTNVGWHRVNLPIPAGNHTVEWQSIVAGDGKAWVDEVVLTAPPLNDGFANRVPIFEGTTQTSLLAASNDGSSSLSQPGRPDTWFVYTAPGAGTLQVNSCGTFDFSGVDTVLSLHVDDGVVGSSANEVTANDQWVGGDPNATPCASGFNDSTLVATMSAGESLVLRVSDFPDFAGAEDGTRNVLINVAFEADATDTDFDGITDDVDNCTFKANFDQADTDGDNIGNLCDGDIAVPNDCIVNASDLGIFKAAFFSTPAAPNWNPDADFTNDNVVNAADLGILRQGFFQQPGPSAMGCN